MLIGLVVVLSLICVVLFREYRASLTTIGAICQAQCQLGMGLDQLSKPDSAPEALQPHLRALSDIAASCEHYSTAWSKRSLSGMRQAAGLQQVRALKLQRSCKGLSVDEQDQVAERLEKIVRGILPDE